MSMPRRRMLAALCAVVSALLLAACGATSVSVSSISKCAHAKPYKISAATPNEAQIVAKTVHGGWLAQDVVEESEAEQDENAPGFSLYVFKDEATAKQAFALFQHAPDPQEEFGAGGTFLAKNVIASTDQNPPGALVGYANTLLKKCVGSAASQSLYRPNGLTSEASGSGSTGNEDPTTTETAPTSEGGEVGASSEDETSAGQSPLPTTTE
jgi:hypothetical protein